MKVTLNSIMLAVLQEDEGHSAKFESDVATFVGVQSAALADYLVDKSDTVEIISRLLTATVALIPRVLEREAETSKKRKVTSDDFIRIYKV
ncbi:hypothetical protein ACP3S7_30435 [Phytobacter ursingii]